jgi:quercetin dioxygenase-like cupin family protein
MEIQPKKPSAKGPAEFFTGDVWIDSIVQSDDPRLSVGAVHFTPGARTAWHSHTLGQTLQVTEGEGLVQSRTEPIVAIRAGDVVRTPADEWHWHGAKPDHFMTHISMTQGDAHWGDHVTDAEYHGEAPSAS